MKKPYEINRQSNYYLKTLFVIMMSFTLVVSIPVKAAEWDYNEFLKITFKEGIDPGESQKLEVCLNEHEAAIYIIYIVSPGDLEYYFEASAEFIQWLHDYDWESFSWGQSLIDYENWRSQHPERVIDIAAKYGVLWTDGNPCETIIYPVDFFVLSGDPNTLEMGRYDVITVGLCSKEHSISHNWFYTSFLVFVVPAFPLGTITPILSSLTALGFWIKRRKN